MRSVSQCEGRDESLLLLLENSYIIPYTFYIVLFWEL